MTDLHDDKSTPFEIEFNKLICRELSACGTDLERRSALVETVANALGTTIAMCCNGLPAAIEEMFAGAENYAHEVAVAKAPIARMLAGTRQ